MGSFRGLVHFESIKSDQIVLQVTAVDYDLSPSSYHTTLKSCKYLAKKHLVSRRDWLSVYQATVELPLEQDDLLCLELWGTSKGSLSPSHRLYQWGLRITYGPVVRYLYLT